MKDDVLVTFEHVSKKFCRNLKRSMLYGVQDIAGEMLGYYGRNAKLRKDEFWALNDINFELKKGECLGLIGRNGAGKSTILKLINGLIKPDAGKVTVRGRVGALIELGAGFNPILTGRENIYINGAVLGFSKKEIDKKFDAIVDFAEIDEFIDTPVQNYSSGMKVRLGFAIAAQMEPDVLLIDEVLAVGDVGFRAKCYNTIYNLNRNAAVIFVSHSMPQVSRLCSEVLFLCQGKIKEYGSNIFSIIQNYFDIFDIKKNNLFKLDGVNVDSMRINNEDCNNYHEIEYGGNFQISFDAIAPKVFQKLEVSLTFLNQTIDPVAQCNSKNNKTTICNDGKQKSFFLRIENLNLSPGAYFLSLSIVNEDNNDILYWNHALTTLKVKGNFFTGVPVCFKQQWEIHG